MSILEIFTQSDVEKALRSIEESAVRAQNALAALPSQPMQRLAAMKFNPIGYHPLEDRPLNVIEQVNQTFTYLVAVKAAEFLLKWHPETQGLRLAPGAHAPRGTLDIESLEPDLIGAETFAAVHPDNNRKLKKDLEKLASRTETHRYIFFISPEFPETKRLPEKETDGVTVYSLALEV